MDNPSYYRRYDVLRQIADRLEILFVPRTGDLWAIAAEDAARLRKIADELQASERQSESGGVESPTPTP